MTGLAAALAVGSAAAQEIRGGDFELSHSFFSDDRGANRLSLEGSMEIGLTPRTSVQLDAALYHFGSGDNGDLIALHGIYRATDKLALGVYVGTEEFADEDVTLYGIEGSFAASPRLTFEAHFGRLDDGATDANAFGLQADYFIRERGSVGLELDRVSSDEIGFDSFSRAALVGRYFYSTSVSSYLEVGRVGPSGAKETFVGIGVNYGFGPNRSATFDRRGFLSIVPGL